MHMMGNVIEFVTVTTANGVFLFAKNVYLSFQLHGRLIRY